MFIKRVLFTKHITQKRKQWKEGVVVYLPPHTLHLKECIGGETTLMNGEVSPSLLKERASETLATAYHNLSKNEDLQETLFDGFLIDPQEDEPPSNQRQETLMQQKAPLAKLPRPSPKRPHMEKPCLFADMVNDIRNNSEDESWRERFLEAQNKWKNGEPFPKTERVFAAEENSHAACDNRTEREKQQQKRMASLKDIDTDTKAHLQFLIESGKASQEEVSKLFAFGDWHFPPCSDEPRRRDSSVHVNKSWS